MQEMRRRLARGYAGAEMFAKTDRGSLREGDGDGADYTHEMTRNAIRDTFFSNLHTYPYIHIDWR